MLYVFIILFVVCLIVVFVFVAKIGIIVRLAK